MSDGFGADAVDRVVRRAVELERAELDAVMAPETVLALAVEAGISPSAARRSLAIERLGPAPATGFLDRIVGPRAVVAEIEAPLSDADAVGVLDDWLTKGHHLRRGRRSGATVEWTKRTDVLAGAARAVRSMTGEGGLGAVHRVQATVAPIDDRRCLVRVMVDRTASRSTFVGLAGGVSVVSVGGAALAATAVPPLALGLIPGLVVAGAAASGGRWAAARIERELERLLTHVIEGQRPRSLRRSVTGILIGRH